MANKVLTIKEGDVPGTLTDITVLDVGRQPAIDSKSVALSSEDKATSDAILAALVGNVAHGAADAGVGSKIAFKALASPKGVTPVATAARTDAYSDTDGMQFVKLNTSNADLISESVINSDGAATAFANFTAVAATRNYVTHVSVYRTDAGTAMAYVEIQNGVGGSILWRLPLPAGGGSSFTSAVPLFKSSANTALAFDVSTTLASIHINMSGFQSKV